MSEEQEMQQSPNTKQTAEVLSVGDYFVTYLLGTLTCSIMYFVWAFSSGTNPNKANLCKFILLMYLIVVVFYILVIVIGGVAFLSQF